jgi:hypothetical protein
MEGRWAGAFLLAVLMVASSSLAECEFPGVAIIYLQLPLT